MPTCNDYLLALVIAAGLTVGGAALDGPSDHELAQAAALDLEDARASAGLFEQRLRRCRESVGPAGELIEIEGSDGYVCRTKEGWK